ncbi:hypothetical protein CG706_25805 [Escherichia coli]|nr:glycosyltransferase [Escherichia coli]OZO51551.1 hypothetical protein CG706_25805 [Escherichia coli]
MNKPKVAVLLATYNGECWISAQIDSILAQRDVDVTIYISDDCSTDKQKRFAVTIQKDLIILSYFQIQNGWGAQVLIFSDYCFQMSMINMILLLYLIKMIFGKKINLFMQLNKLELTAFIPVM